MTPMTPDAAARSEIGIEAFALGHAADRAARAVRRQAARNDRRPMSRLAVGLNPQCPCAKVGANTHRLRLGGIA